jgi:CDP-glycerol glycerophosphotransferase
VSGSKKEKKDSLCPHLEGTHVSKAKNDIYQIIADMTYLKEQIGEEYNKKAMDTFYKVLD